MSEFSVIKYFFQNRKDASMNYMLLPKDKYKLETVADVLEALSSCEMIDEYCHLRFRDSFESQLIWFDITNAKANVPRNSKHEIEIKILTLPYALKRQKRKSYSSASPVEDQKQPRLAESLEPPATQALSKEDRRISKNGFTNSEALLAETNAKIDGLLQERKSKSTTADSYIHENPVRLNRVPSVQKEHQSQEFEFDFINSSAGEKVQADDDDLLELGGYAAVKSAAEITTPGQNIDFFDFEPAVSTQSTVVTITTSSGAPTTVQWEVKIRGWAYKNDIRRDIRSLLTTTNFLSLLIRDWQPFYLHELMEDSDLKKAFHKVIKTLHPDKRTAANSEEAYVLERVVSELTDAFKEFKKFQK